MTTVNRAVDIQESLVGFNQTLQSTLRGSVTSKLNILGHIIYEEGKERFGEMPQRRVIPKQSEKTREGNLSARNGTMPLAETMEESQ